MTHATATPGETMPEFTLNTLDGGTAKVGGSGRWQLFIVYRGSHCPLCKKYLIELERLRPQFEEADIDVVTASVDDAERARPFIEETGLQFPVGVGLSREQLKTLGVYVSEPRPNEAPAPFAEPATYVTNPDGRLQIVDVSNAPFSRPDLEGLLNGIKFVRDKDYPIRGQLAA